MKYCYESRSDAQNYHYVNHRTGPFVALHFHSAYEMVMVKRGRMLAVVNGEEITVEAGEGCFVDSFSLHSYSELLLDTEVYSFVGSSVDLDTAFSEIGGIPPVKFKFSDFELLDKIFTYYKSIDGAKGVLFRGAFELVLAVITSENGTVAKKKSDKTADICAILRYISEHFTENISLASISAHFGYTPQYFSKLFHRYMRTNLTEYINVARVNYAKKLFDARTEKNVAEVAFESGFSSLPSFYRAYKKVFGKLPRG